METTNQSPVRLLIAEHDEAARLRLLECFQALGYTVTMASDGQTAFNLLHRQPGYDLVIMNTDLPGRDGFKVLEDAERLPIDTAFLMVSAHDDVEARLKGFSLGAEDYVVGPYDLDELAARAKAILSRRFAPAATEPTTHVLQDLTIDFSSRVCYRDGVRIRLTALEFDMLRHMVKHRGRTVSREDIIGHVWESTDGVSTRTIDRHMAKIRSKLERDASTPEYIQTIYGKGYRFVNA